MEERAPMRQLEHNIHTKKSKQKNHDTLNTGVTG